jgi:hypothetical protein
VLDVANAAQLPLLSAPAAENSVLTSLFVATEDESVHRTEGYVKDWFTEEEINLHEISEEDEMLAEIFANSELSLIVHAMNQQLAGFCQESTVLTSCS